MCNNLNFLDKLIRPNNKWARLDVALDINKSLGKIMTKYLPTIILCAILSTIPAKTFSKGMINGCTDILQYSAREYSEESSEIAVAVNLYNKYCENASLKTGESFGFDVETVIKEIPTKFMLNSGSTEDRLRHFCKTFDSDYKSNEIKFKKISSVVNKTTDAWLQCIKLASKDVIFQPHITKTIINVDITRDTATPVTIQGIKTNPDKRASCTAPNNNQGAAVVDEQTTKALKSETWTITCTRIPEQTANETIYPGFDLSISTTEGSFLLPIPPDAEFKYQWASDMQREFKNELDSLKKQIKDLKQGSNACKWKSKIKLQAGNMSKDNYKGDKPEDGLWANSFSCEKGYYIRSIQFGLGAGESPSAGYNALIECCPH